MPPPEDNQSYAGGVNAANNWNFTAPEVDTSVIITVPEGGPQIINSLNSIKDRSKTARGYISNIDAQNAKTSETEGRCFDTLEALKANAADFESLKTLLSSENEIKQTSDQEIYDAFDSCLDEYSGLIEELTSSLTAEVKASAGKRYGKEFNANIKAFEPAGAKVIEEVGYSLNTTKLSQRVEKTKKLLKDGLAAAES